MTKWLTNGKNDDVVISTRIRLARNLKDEFFPSIMDEEGFNRVYLKVKNLLNENGDFEFVKMKDLTPVQKRTYLEKHLASKEVIKNNYGALAISNDESLVVMINEEDHLRIQSLVSGFDIQKAFDKIFSFESKLKDKFAYDEQFGYLTACPTNTGTGMRVSVMLHIPGLIKTNQMRNITNAVMKMGMTIRGVYGEGSESVGNIVQISNQITLGLNEQEIAKNVEAVVAKIIENELQARKLIYENNKDRASDSVYRSLGILKYARNISSNELMNKLSDLCFGKSVGILTNVEYKDIYKLMIDCKPNILLNENSELSSDADRDKYRATKVRKALTTIE